MDCLFCKIKQKEIPSDIIYETDQLFAISDINPKAPTHILIIPKKHIPTINDLGEEDTQIVGEMVQAAKHISADLGIAENGYRLVFNVNQYAGQVIYHIHLHLLGGRSMKWPPG